MNDSSAALPGTLALFAATVAVIFGVALTRDDEVATPVSPEAAPASDAAGAKLDSDELLDLSVERAPAVARRVAEIRGIRFEEVPEPQVTDTESLRELAEKEVAKPKAAETIAASDAELKLLGMLEPDESLSDVATDVTADAAAYYDPAEEGALSSRRCRAGRPRPRGVRAGPRAEPRAGGSGVRAAQVQRLVGRPHPRRIGARRGLGDSAHDRVRRRAP